ncbi:MAG TPA: hypothetical protein PK052_04515 [Anaerohalosphaeraceae bacterium]|nr:hypothetical protein [Anaerohalosphaeraceae bacterium]HOL31224.1 hypothetical protein [Anaerohalosphaeraceae bacterium]HOM76501.1 hypothetical protein [Anaerohalosphaeraceae bacterium]HPC63835.1 hypothetical protein [Anaerohalosphaeraceae bacterium]HPO69490.1 hypothetical protein [Anaerohalosphaeraceae bacterium]
MKSSVKKCAFIYFCLSLAQAAFCAAVILNEYNAVAPDTFLGGGTFAADAKGGRASDYYFGRIMGNGGDWFELIVITDHLDMRNWKLDIYENDVLDETLDLTNHSIWSDLRSGTIITVSEDVPSDISYNPADGDWWINVQANNTADGRYIEASSFPVSSSNWQLRIRNAAGAIIFGPAGEGISPAAGIGSDEVFKLKANPSSTTAANSADYDGDDKLSTFGQPNQWGQQNLNSLRTVAPAPSTLTLIAPNGTEVIKSGSFYPIEWQSTGTINNVLIEFSTDNGQSWSGVYPPNIGNSGRYVWQVPVLNTDNGLIRITNMGNPAVMDASNAAFSIYECPLKGDATDDCIIDLNDLAVIANSWLDCANPYLNCMP